MPSKQAVEKLLSYNYPPDEMMVEGKRVYLFLPDGYGKTKFNNSFIENKLGVSATTRNWHTCLTLLEMCSWLIQPSFIIQRYFLSLSFDTKRKWQRKSATADKSGFGFRPLHMLALTGHAPQPHRTSRRPWTATAHRLLWLKKIICGWVDRPKRISGKGSGFLFAAQALSKQYCLIPTRVEIS